MKLVKMLSVVILSLVLAAPAMAQKFAFVQSQRILAEYKEYTDAQNKLDEIRNRYDAEYQQMVKEYNTMIQEIDSQSLLLSPEKKEEKMRQAQEKAVQIERYKYEKLGPEGEFYRKNLELTKPIIDKINDLIAKVGEEDGYDFIFDASSGALVHALPKFDITDKILVELNKIKSAATTKAK
ncbi:MAG: OmpH family outer membrane protein [Calditrichaceae bacterium]